MSGQLRRGLAGSAMPGAPPQPHNCSWPFASDEGGGGRAVQKRQRRRRSRA